MPRANVLLKVYGHVWPAPPALEAALAALAGEAVPPAEPGAPPVLERVGDMLRISFEGMFFPIDDAVAALRAHIGPTAQGKLDCIDLDAWSLTRHSIAAGVVSSGTVPLNHVLDHSGH